MSLVSLEFVVFVILTTTVYYIVPKRFRWVELLISSVYFYCAGWSNKKAFVTLLAVSLFTFIAARQIENSREELRKRKFYLSVSVVAIVGWLMLTKTVGEGKFYFLVVPIGISYISFSLISYLADVYWEKDIADKNFLKFFLYVLFFPKITQGPITRHKDFAPLLYDGGDLSYENICFGAQRMLYGYFKKLVVADRAAVFTDAVFGDVAAHSGSLLVTATVLAAFELYCDFSGYMDIVLGFTQMLGISMDENFRRPFYSKSAAEFWRRWHITLGTWFKDYVYTPIVMSHSVKKLGKWGRKNVSKRFGNSVMKILALAAVWFLTGAWHGISINYIMWGVMWGFLIIISVVFEEEITRATKILHVNTEAASWKLYQMARTFLIFCFGIMLTRVHSIHEIKLIANNILKQFRIWEICDGTIYGYGLDKGDFKVMLFGLLIIFVVESIQEKKGKGVRQYIAELNAPVRWIIYAIAVSIVIFLGIYGEGYSTADFAYQYF